MLNKDLNPTFLAQKVNMSRTILHKKLKKITNLSASHFINHIRLKKAMNLLIKQDKNISEIAYITGFSDPAYFTRYYKKIFGKTPKEFIRESTKNLHS